MHRSRDRVLDPEPRSFSGCHSELVQAQARAEMSEMVRPYQRMAWSGSREMKAQKPISMLYGTQEFRRDA